MRVQALAIALVVASGIALFVGTATTSRALRLSEARYYSDQRFAQVWSGLSRAPEALVQRLAVTPGVTAVEGRLVAQGVLDLPDVAEPATGLFISIPTKPGHTLNDVYIRRGRHLTPGSSTEVLVSEAFAERNGLRPGNHVRAVIAGQQVTLQIVGVALSPEFIMQIPPGGLIPDDRRFGVFWMAHERLAELLDLRGAINDVALRLSDPASEAKVVAAVDRELKAYGGHGAFGRASHPSHVMLENHIRPVAALAVVVPSLFLAVAVFLVNVVLSRLVAIERGQIGMLKAFGYSNMRLVRHYLSLVLSIVALGIVIGLPIGVWLGHLMSTWFGTFFRFPILVFRVEPLVVATGALAMVATTALGTFATLRAVVRMPPIVAMTPAAPLYRPTFIDRAGAWLYLGRPPARMIVRSLSRRPVRAALTAGGMALAIAIIVFGGFTGDALARVIDVRFQRQERQDLSFTLAHARSLQQWNGIEKLPGIRVAEPYRAVPVRVPLTGRIQDATLIGLPPRSQLHRLMDVRYVPLPVPPDGVVMSAWLATRSGVRRGDPIAIEIRDGRQRVVLVHVAATLDEPLGTSLYMDLGALGRLLEEPETFTAVNVLADSTAARALYDTLKHAPEVLAVDFRTSALANFRAMGDETVAFIRRIEVIFAVIIAFGVVYNTTRIALAERAHELATLRVLGFTRGEISAILLGEVGALAVPAVPIGCLLGYGFSAFLSGALSSDLFRFPLVLEPRTYALGVGVFLIASLTSALVVRQRLDRLDLVAALKARE